ncbi:hypothetical protein V9T40_011142 [Parthenolecanium corni]|uniref:SOCS box domain-containing protein n=1 Tax=Parthenolecanium corni TaxID=536013 RepID=A0AAN9T6G1_9HEMI
MSTPTDPISCSIQQNDINTLLQLLEELKKNQLPLPAGDKNWTALHHAASEPQYKEYLKLLLEYSDSILMDFNGQTNDGKTALHIACENCCEESVLILLQKGCDPYKVTSGEVESGYHEDTSFPQENGKFSALHIAVTKGCSKIVEYLLDYPENINEPDKWGQTPLHRAAAGKSNSEVGRILFEKGADVRLIDRYGNLPLHYACLSNNLDMIFLIECDLTLINCTNNEGCTPLMLAAKSGADVCGLHILCENGAKIDICDESGWTALHYAAANGKVEVLECILQYTEASCFEAWFSNKLNNVLNAGGKFVSLTCACIKWEYRRNEKCLEMLLSSNKLSQSILQAPNIDIDFRNNACKISSPLAYLFALCYNTQKEESFYSHLQLLLKYEIIMLDEFFKVYKVKWPECHFRIEFVSPFDGILRDSRLPSSKKHHYFHLLNANGITIDYSLQCYHDINTQSFATFTNYASYYMSVIDEMRLQVVHGSKLLKLILPNSVILEPDNLILLYHKFVNYYVSSDDAEELYAKRKYRKMHAYLTSLKPVYYKQPRKYHRYSFLSYPYNTIGEEFSKSTLKQLCRTVIRQHLREPTLEGNLRNFQRKILQLPLSTFLKDYLLFKY